MPELESKVPKADPAEPMTLPAEHRQDRTAAIKRLALVTTLLISSAGILGWLVFHEWDTLLAYDWRLRWEGGLVAAGLYTAALALSVWVWASVMSTLGTNLPLTRHWYYVSLSNLAKRLPGTLWYVAGRAQFYRSHGVTGQVTSLGSAMEMGASAVAGVLVSAVFAGPIMARHNVSLVWLIPVLTAGILVLHPSVLEWLLRRLGIQAERVRYRQLFRWVVAHILIWLLGGGMLVAIVGMFVEVSVDHWGYIVGSWALVGTLSTLVLFLPSNLGVTEVGLSLLLVSIVPGPIAVLAALSVRLTTIAFELAWALGVLVWFRPGRGLD